MNVDQLILQRLPTTIIVIGSSQVLAILVALPVGILAAVKPYSWFDRIASTVALVGFSLPTVLHRHLFILLVSASTWAGCPSSTAATSRPPAGSSWWWEHFKQSIMPISVLGLFQAASMMRYVRSAVLDVSGWTT